MKKKDSLLVMGGEEAFLESVTIPFVLSFPQKRELGLSVLTLITYCDNKMSQRQLGLIKWMSKRM